MNRVVCIREQLWLHFCVNEDPLQVLWALLPAILCTLLVFGMTCAGIIFLVHCPRMIKAPNCMLFAGGILPVNNDESMLHHVLVESC